MSHAKRSETVAPSRGENRDAISLSCGVRTGRHLHVNAIATWAAMSRHTAAGQVAGRPCWDRAGSGW